MWKLVVFLVTAIISVFTLAKFDKISFLDTNEKLEVHTVVYLNKNMKLFHGEKVIVKGFVKFGYDGRHIECSVAVGQHPPESLDDIIWLDTSDCYKKKTTYRKGLAIITGRFNDNDGEEYISGGLYKSSITVQKIKWLD